MPKKQIKQGPVRLNRIKVVLVEKNILQKDLAQRVKKDTNSISKICNNLVQPSLKLLFEISIALNVDVRTLITPTEEIKDAFTKERKKNIENTKQKFSSYLSFLKNMVFRERYMNAMKKELTCDFQL